MSGDVPYALGTLIQVGAFYRGVDATALGACLMLHGLGILLRGIRP